MKKPVLGYSFNYPTNATVDTSQYYACESCNTGHTPSYCGSCNWRENIDPGTGDFKKGWN